MKQPRLSKLVSSVTPTKSLSVENNHQETTLSVVQRLRTFVSSSRCPVQAFAFSQRCMYQLGFANNKIINTSRSGMKLHIIMDYNGP
jgi:GMP synthase-like glutamine amidotransferase